MINIIKENELAPNTRENIFKQKWIAKINKITNKDAKKFLKKNLIVFQMAFIKLSFSKFKTEKYNIAKKLIINTTKFDTIIQTENTILSVLEIFFTKMKKTLKY